MFNTIRIIFAYHLKVNAGLRKLCKSIAYTFIDEIRIVKLLNDKKKRLYKIRLAALNGKPVFCRSRTSDSAVLSSAFISKFHVPPPELLIDSDPVIVDLGCNIGFTMAHFKSLYPKAKVIGIEMDRENYNLCRKNIAHFPDCHVLHAAVWTSNGVVEYSGHNEESYSLTGVIASKATSLQSYTADALTIDSIIAKFFLTRIDYLKMDIEGVEVNLLEGDLSWTQIVKAMYIEIHNTDKVNAAEFVPIAIEKLTALGYSCKKSNKHWYGIFAWR